MLKTEEKQDLMRSLHDKYGRRFVANEQKRINGVLELFDYLRSLTNEQLREAIRMERWMEADRKEPSGLLPILFGEEFERLWEIKENREELRRKYGTVPKIKEALKSLKAKLKKHNGEKEENG